MRLYGVPCYIQNHDTFQFTFALVNEVSLAVQAVLSSTNEEERKNADTWLCNWERNPESIGTAIEIIETSFDQNVLFFGGKCIEFLLTHFHDKFNEMTIEQVFRSLQRRINNSFAPGLSEMCTYKFLDCITIIATIFPNYIDTFQEFPLNLLPHFFKNLLENFPNGSQQFIEKIKSFFNNIFFILEKADISIDWILLLVWAIKIIYFDSYVHFYPFMPKIEMIPYNSDYYPAFIDLLTTITGDENYTEDQGNIAFIQRIFEIGIGICDILTHPPYDDVSIQLASYIWSEIIDYDSQFLSNCVSSFSLVAFEHFCASLPSFAELPHELIELFLLTGEQFNNLSQEPSFIHFLPFVPRFLDFMIMQIDQHVDIYCVNRVAKGFYAFSDIPLYLNTLLDFFGAKIQQGITPGLIYAITSSSPLVHTKFLPTLSEALVKSPLSPIALHFIRICCEHLPQEVNSQAIILIYNEFGNNLNSPSAIFYAKTIKSLIKHFYNPFLENEESLILPLLNWLQNSPPELVIPINQILLNLIYRVPVEQSEAYHIPQIVEAIVNSYTNLFTQLFQTSDSNYFIYLNKFAKCSQSMSKLEYWGPNNVACNTFKIIYQQIFTLMSSLWNNPQQEVVVESFCDFLLQCMESKIITNQIDVIQFIIITIRQTPVKLHFDLLKKLTNYLPIDDIMIFLQNINQVNDEQVIYYGLCFIKDLLDIKWSLFFLYFKIDYILQFLSLNDQRIIYIIIYMIDYMLENASQVVIESLNIVMVSLLGGIFTNFDDGNIHYALNFIIKLVQNGVCQPNNVLQTVLDNMKLSQHEVNELQNVLLMQRLNENALFMVVKRIIINRKET